MLINRQFRLDNFFRDSFNGDYPERSFLFVEKSGETFSDYQVKYCENDPLEHRQYNGAAYAVSDFGFIAVPVVLEEGDVVGPVFCHNIERAFTNSGTTSNGQIKLGKNWCSFGNVSRWPRIFYFDNRNQVPKPDISQYIFEERLLSSGPPTQHINTRELLYMQESMCSDYAVGGTATVRLSWLSYDTNERILVEPTRKKISSGIVPLPYGVIWPYKSGVRDSGFLEFYNESIR